MTLTTSTPKSKHPVNPSFRFDEELSFKTLELKDCYNETAVFKILQDGKEVATCKVGADRTRLALVLIDEERACCVATGCVATSIAVALM